MQPCRRVFEHWSEIRLLRCRIFGHHQTGCRGAPRDWLFRGFSKGWFWFMQVRNHPWWYHPLERLEGALNDFEWMISSTWWHLFLDVENNNWYAPPSTTLHLTWKTWLTARPHVVKWWDTRLLWPTHWCNLRGEGRNFGGLRVGFGGGRVGCFVLPSWEKIKHNQAHLLSSFTAKFIDVHCPIIKKRCILHTYHFATLVVDCVFWTRVFQTDLKKIDQN